MQRALGQAVDRLSTLGAMTLGELSKQTDLLGALHREAQLFNANLAAIHVTLDHGLGSIAEELYQIKGYVKLLEMPVEAEAANHFQIGLRMLSRNYLKEAERKFKEARQQDPSNYSVHIALGITCAGQDRLDDAANCFQHAERNAETNNQMAYACLLRARALFAQHHNVLAAECCERGISFAPDDGECWYLLAAIHAADGADRECARALAASFERDANNYNRALADPQFTERRRLVFQVCRAASRRAFQEAAPIIRKMRSHFNSLIVEPELSFFAPRSTDRLEKRLAAIESSLHEERYLSNRNAITQGNLIYNEIRNAADLACENQEHHWQTFRERWYGSIQNVIAKIVIWSLLAAPLVALFGACAGLALSAKEGAITGALTGAAVGGIIGILLVAAVFVPIHLLKRSVWHSEEFIKSLFRDE